MAASASPTAPGYMTTAPMRNGLGIAALCCGLVGILFGLSPLLFQGSGALGLAAIVFGIAGIRRVGRGEASNRGMAIAGLVTGVAALALAIYGVSIVMSGLNSISSELDNVNTGSAPASALHAVFNQEDRMVHQWLWIGNG
jgi:hypothetical protein